MPAANPQVCEDAAAFLQRVAGIEAGRTARTARTARSAEKGAGWRLLCSRPNLAAPAQPGLLSTREPAKMQTRHAGGCHDIAAAEPPLAGANTGADIGVNFGANTGN